MLTVLEPGDHVTRRQFINFVNNLKAEFENVEMSGNAHHAMNIIVISMNSNSTLSMSTAPHASSLDSSESSKKRNNFSDGCPYAGYR